MKLELYHENPKISQVGAKKAHAYFVPFSELDSVREISKNLQENPELDLRELSDRLLFLNDDWFFQYYESYQDVPSDFGSGPILSEFSDQTIPVPSNWQNHGFDIHQYTNIRYPFPVDPPYVPDETPCAAYEYFFDLDAEQLENRALLNFEGVDSCIYLWINGEFVGYSQVSHVTHEFDITDYLQAGENILQALVLKWNDGSYLEDQDKFRMSGIFRDVYILFRPENYIQDFHIKQELNDDLTEASLTVDVDWNSEEETGTSLELVDPSTGDLIAEFKPGETVQIKNVKLWNAEEPFLYSLHVSTDKEAFRQDVGFRKIEIKGDTFYLNNQNIKIKGVNRHDSDPITGYYIQPHQLLKDLSIMKQYNVNAVRTAHYPNAPWAYEYFSRFGFYVMDEADIEMHGSFLLFGDRELKPEVEVQNVLPHSTYSYLASLEMFWDGIQDRVERMVYRDRNHSSIVIWSLGNESGYSKGFEDTAKWLKSIDSSRPVQFESNIYQKPYYDSDLTELDFTTRMYPELEMLDEYIETEGERKPYIAIEYIHAMGNGPGSIEGYWERFYQNDCMSGGFAWEWCDHAIYKGKSDNGQDIYWYGGEHGEDLHDGNFCVDGLVKPNREVSPALAEYGNVIRPIRLTQDANAAAEGKISITNMLDFSDAGKKYALYYEYLKDSEVLIEGMVLDYSLAARDTVEIDLELSEEELSLLSEIKEAGENSIYLNISYLNIEDSHFVPEYTEMGFDQIILYETEEIVLENTYTEFSKLESSDLVVEEQDRYLYISGENFRYTFDKRKAMFSDLVYEQDAVFAKPMELNIWRAPTDNDMYIKKEWKEAGLDRTLNKVKSLDYGLDGDNFKIRSSITMSAKALQPVAQVEITYLIKANGELEIALNVDRSRNQPWWSEFEEFPFTEEERERYAEKFTFLPRFGVRLFLNKNIDNLQFVGNGPAQSYEDMHDASLQGKWKTTVSEQYVDFIKPQEHGSHTATSSILLHNDFGTALGVSADKKFSFNASHYTQEILENTAHNYELEESPYTVLCLDYRMSGLGSNSCGPLTLKEFRLNEEKFDIAFTLALGSVIEIE